MVVNRSPSVSLVCVLFLCLLFLYIVLVRFYCQFLRGFYTRCARCLNGDLLKNTSFFSCLLVFIVHFGPLSPMCSVFEWSLVRAHLLLLCLLVLLSVSFGLLCQVCSELEWSLVRDNLLPFNFSRFYRHNTSNSFFWPYISIR